MAKYSYTNPNSTAVYVPIGTDNNITGTYSGTQPQVFLPGTGRFEIYFNGLTLKWTLTTYNGSQKTSTASNASSTSNKCGTTTYSRGEQQNNPVENVPNITAEHLNAVPVINAKSIKAFPNPVTDKLVIQTGNSLISTRDLLITDLSGKIYRGMNINKTGPYSLEINMSTLKSGIYFIKVKSGVQYKVVKVFKQ